MRCVPACDDLYTAGTALFLVVSLVSVLFFDTTMFSTIYNIYYIYIYIYIYI